jgi:hypothetical protein
MDEFLDSYNILKLNKENINNSNKSIMSNEIEVVIVSQ